MPQSLRIQMLAFPNCQILDVVGPLQMFAGVNDELGRSAYELLIAAPDRGLFKTNSGMCLNADLAFADVAAGHFRCTDTVIAAGGDDGVRAQLASGEITALIKAAQCDGARIVSVCTGAFFLAAAGILDGRRAATHWEGVEKLRRFRPQVEVDAESIYVRDGDVWTSAGVTAGIDLALALIEADYGRDVALAVARRHVVFPIRPGGQSQFSPNLAAHGVRDRRLSRLAERIAQRPSNDWCVGALAAEGGVSLRSLSRLFRRELDASPAEFVERVRVDRARRALLETDDAVETIALDCGFGSLRRMDRAFARTIAATPSEFRDRFKPSSQGESKCLTSMLAS
jgi:transcriptional regulator GlxA family with amidase domain